MKNLKFFLILNITGLLTIFLCLFGYRGHSLQEAPQRISIDEELLKNELSLYSTKDLQKMLCAGEEITKWNEILAKTGSHVVDEVLKGQGVFYRMDHYPLEDAFDRETYSQYYFHAHRGGEKGHFHLFLRKGGMEEGILPIYSLDDSDTYAHLIAISMDNEGRPQSLFTTNRWVTGEDWYSADDIKKMVDHFEVRHAQPSYVVNRFLNAMLVVFRPQIDRLIEERDEVLTRRANGVPLKEVLDDEKIDIAAEKRISIDLQIKVIKNLLTPECY